MDPLDGLGARLFADVNEIADLHDPTRFNDQGAVAPSSHLSKLRSINQTPSETEQRRVRGHAAQRISGGLAGSHPEKNAGPPVESSPSETVSTERPEPP